MIGHGTQFGHKKEIAIAALLTQRNIEDAARAVGINSKTLLRWYQLPEFKEAFRAARREAFSQSVARLQQASSLAVSTLLKIMLDVTAPAAVRVRAADCVLEHGARGMELEDIEVRVSQLEKATALNVGFEVR